MKLYEIFPDFMTDGAIFTAISSVSGYTPPWSTQITAQQLDDLFIGRSGQKYASPFMNYFLVDGVLSSSGLSRLASSLVGMYEKNWDKMWDTLLQEYTLISNYNMTETESVDSTLGGTSSESDTYTYGKTNSKLRENTEEEENSIWGFNSTSSVNSDAALVTESATETETQGGSDGATKSSSKSETDTSERTLTREGNIGVTTNQQMLQQERELWLWNYFEYLFKSVDDVLTLRVY